MIDCVEYLLKQVLWELGTQVVTALHCYGNKDSYGMDFREHIGVLEEWKW